jgi:hypothetical protein
MRESTRSVWTVNVFASLTVRARSAATMAAEASVEVVRTRTSVLSMKSVWMGCARAPRLSVTMAMAARMIAA